MLNTYSGYWKHVFWIGTWHSQIQNICTINNAICSEIKNINEGFLAVLTFQNIFCWSLLNFINKSWLIYWPYLKKLKWIFGIFLQKWFWDVLNIKLIINLWITNYMQIYIWNKKWNLWQFITMFTFLCWHQLLVA